MKAHIVVDASVAVKWLLYEKGSDEALRLRKSRQKSGTVFIAPDFILIELHNIFWKKIQQGNLTHDLAALGLSPTFGLALEWISSIALLPRATRLALDYGITVYDGLYAALAQQHGCPLWTADAKLNHSLKTSPVRIEMLAAQ